MGRIVREKNFYLRRMVILFSSEIRNMNCYQLDKIIQCILHHSPIPVLEKQPVKYKRRFTASTCPVTVVMFFFAPRYHTRPMLPTISCSRMSKKKRAFSDLTGLHETIQQNRISYNEMTCCRCVPISPGKNSSITTQSKWQSSAISYRAD